MSLGLNDGSLEFRGILKTTYALRLAIYGVKYEVRSDEFPDQTSPEGDGRNCRNGFRLCGIDDGPS